MRTILIYVVAAVWTVGLLWAAVELTDPHCVNNLIACQDQP